MLYLNFVSNHYKAGKVMAKAPAVEAKQEGGRINYKPYGDLFNIRFAKSQVRRGGSIKSIPKNNIKLIL